MQQIQDGPASYVDFIGQGLIKAGFAQTVLTVEGNK